MLIYFPSLESLENPVHLAKYCMQLERQYRNKQSWDQAKKANHEISIAAFYVQFINSSIQYGKALRICNSAYFAAYIHFVTLYFLLSIVAYSTFSLPITLFLHTDWSVQDKMLSSKTIVYNILKILRVIIFSQISWANQLN